MKESEKEESRVHINVLWESYKNTELAMREIVSIVNKPDNWTSAFSDDNVWALMTAVQPLKNLSKPKSRELRKLLKTYEDLINVRLLARHYYLAFKNSGNMSKIQLSKIIY